MTVAYENGADDTNGVKGVNGAKASQEAFVDVSSAIATSTNLPDHVPALLEKVVTSGIAFLSDNTKARTDLLDAARALVYATETPREAMIRIAWSQSTLYACIEAGVNMGLFTALSKDDTPKTASALAEDVSAEPKMLGMFHRYLAHELY